MGNVDSTNQTSYNEVVRHSGTGLRNVRPSELRFTHDSISYQFRGGYTLESSLRDLLGNQINIEALPRMQVMHYNGELYVVRGNRRLYLIKLLERFGLVNTITVYVQPFNAAIFEQQHTTDCGGRYVRVRGKQNTDALLTRILEEHRSNPVPANEGCIIL